MHTIADLKNLVALTRAEFEKACDEGQAFYVKKEIQQRLKLYANELRKLEETGGESHADELAVKD